MQMAAEVRRVGKRYSCRASSRFSAYAGFDRDRLMSSRLLNVVHQRESSVKATTVQATMARMSSSLAAHKTQPIRTRRGPALSSSHVLGDANSTTRGRLAGIF